MDEGYTVFALETFVIFPMGQEVFETEEPFLIFISLYNFPHPFWIDRQGHTEEDIIAMDWRTEWCNHAPYAYTKFTNWYFPFCLWKCGRSCCVHARKSHMLTKSANCHFPRLDVDVPSYWNPDDH